MMCFSFFFFKQKTAYEMRISDWSSDVCSSDLVLLQMAVASVADSDGKPQGLVLTFRDIAQTAGIVRELSFRSSHDALTGLPNRAAFTRHLRRCVSEEIGRASCRERVGQYV